MPHEFTTSYIKDSLALLRQYKRFTEASMAQLPEDALAASLGEDENSIAIIVKHMAGNMRSRWVNFLTSDGEKPDRDRDGEFILPPSNREELMKMWETGWKYVFDAIEPLTDDDLGRTVTIRGEPHSVMQAINRQIGHYSLHCGQIIFLAKHLAGAQWKAVTVPRNKSAEYNRKVLAGEASQR
jgi:Protein of unknown function (DUF1572)